MTTSKEPQWHEQKDTPPKHTPIEVELPLKNMDTRYLPEGHMGYRMVVQREEENLYISKPVPNGRGELTEFRVSWNNVIRWREVSKKRKGKA